MHYLFASLSLDANLTRIFAEEPTTGAAKSQADPNRRDGVNSTSYCNEKVPKIARH